MNKNTITRQLALFVIGILFGGVIGFLIAAGNGIELHGHHHDHAVSHPHSE